MAAILYQPNFRRKVQRWPGARLIYGCEWDLLHPYDDLNGTDSGGFKPPEELPGSPLSSTKLSYGPSQPSIIREALGRVPGPENFTFLDFGCGKGRPILVASEFRFKELIGVELSPELFASAQQNVSILRSRFTGRSPIRIVLADAAAFPLPSGDLVIFMYNPFGMEVVRRVVANLEAALADGKRSIFVIYYNPVHGSELDASSSFTRYFAGTIPYAAEERGFGPDEADTVVIWQAGGTLPALPGAEARINVTRPEARAELAL